MWRPQAVAVVVVSGTMMQEQVSARSASGIVISEYRFRGRKGDNDEFIELFNAGSAPVNVSGWLIRSSNNTTRPSLATRRDDSREHRRYTRGLLSTWSPTTVATGYVGAGRVTPNLTYTIERSRR